MAPGVVVVWSGEKPRHHAIPVVGELTLGRELLDDDDIEISRRHVRLCANGDALEVHDLGGRNGTLVNGELHQGTVAVPAWPSVIRIGRTICIGVPEIGAYQDVTPRRLGSTVIAGTSAETCRRIDAVALTEEPLTLLGPLALGRALAGVYAERVGGEHLEVHLDPMTSLPMEKAIDKSRSPRTLILALDRPLTDPDRIELEQWLETDVRLVTVARGTESFIYMPKELTARLMAHRIELPERRFDELPMQFADLAAARAPEIRLHASLIESLLLQIAESEERLLRWFKLALESWLGSKLTLVRGADFESWQAHDAAMRNCVAGRLG